MCGNVTRLRDILTGTHLQAQKVLETPSGKGEGLPQAPERDSGPWGGHPGVQLLQVVGIAGPRAPCRGAGALWEERRSGPSAEAVWGGITSKDTLELAGRC